ncbi:Fic family protein [Microbacterium sp. Sa4CUA7]|uniref:Fic family protein n=1 Tax=Microbacterium pullorum TaxID=2762236 RepID=A0ABR8S3V2_9MICO|nr:Fic family protein [Microbacterium pullorum]MBD7958136.1 Fic family protein [Microbacterium pullorum]
MAHYVERLWRPVEGSSGLSRRDRAPGRYQAYVPDELGADLPDLGAEAREAAETALQTLSRADERIGRRGRFLSHLLIRSESISSSWIEGNRVTPKKLAIAEALQHGPQVALDVIANVRATEQAIEVLADRGREITLEDIEDLQHVIEPRLGHGIRQEQNWVGGPGWSPLRAEFVPPPEGDVRRLVEDLARFVTATGGSPIVRAAIAHAQFETIHPFVDGNGRTGRALIHTVLSRTDALRNVLIPISTVFAGDTGSYIAGLTAYREIPSRLDDWVIGFSTAVERAAENAVRLSEQVEQLDVAIIDRFIQHRADEGIKPAKPRSDALVLKLLTHLAEEPVLTAAQVTQRWSASPAAAHRALTELADAGILARTKDHKGKLVCFTADQHLGLVALTERSNRAGGVDTAIRKPRFGPAAPAQDRGRLLDELTRQVDEDGLYDVDAETYRDDLDKARRQGMSSEH